MRTVGIIAEYNPFHTGHEYHIRAAKELSGADYAVVVMSPDFVQRGEPAIFDKHTRARMALACGADLVLSLPVCYATGSAEYFAEGAVSVLERLGVTDVLCFGAECSDIQPFFEAASVLSCEPEEYAELLRSLLKAGRTYPQARSEALRTYLKHSSDLSDSSFLSLPNNILGIEYCKALQKYGSRMKPLPIQRIGSAYHSDALDGAYCSASALRQAICRSDGRSLSSDAAIRHIPQNCRALFISSCLGAMTSDDFLPILIEKLLSCDSCDSILDISRDLSSRMRSLRYSLIGLTYDQIVAALKTKQITQSRIQRALLHLILGIEKDAVETFRQNGTVYYANVLGFRRSSSPLLRAVKTNSQIPFLTKPSSANTILSGYAAQMWKQDAYASHLYRSIRAVKSGVPFQTIYETSPVIL